MRVQAFSFRDVDSLISLAMTVVLRTSAGLGSNQVVKLHCTKLCTNQILLTSDSVCEREKIRPSKCEERSCAREVLRLTACSLLGEKNGPPLVFFSFESR